MARNTRMPQGATLSPGNIIYLYGLLSRTIGTGKQTFLPRVEEALDAEALGAANLGFESTRALLEAMGDCVSLTVFKGGRIYATLLARPEWDAALTADPGKTSGTARPGKPWKRKKADKSLKPVKPRRVKREEPKGKDAAEQEPSTSQAESVAAPAPADSAAPTSAEMPASPDTAKTDIADAEGAASDTPKPPTASGEKKAAVDADLPTAASETASGDNPDPKETDAEAAASIPSGGTASQPTISLTVTYDPYSGTEGETILEADLGARATVGATGSTTPIEISPAPAADSSQETRPEAPGPALEPETTDASTAGRPEPSAGAPAPTSGTATSPATATAQTTSLAASAAPSTVTESAAPDAAPIASPTVSPAESRPAAVSPGTATPAAAPETFGKPAAPAAAPEPSPDGRMPSAEALAGYPKDFPEEVYCPHELIAELSRLLPLGTSALSLLAEDFKRARTLELIRGTRSQATFPLRVEHPDGTAPITVTLHRQRSGTLPWAVASIR